MAKVSGPGRRSLLIGGAAAAGVAVAAARVVSAKTLAPIEGPWAIELFTSQGCSSCPPADAYLGVLAKRPDIVALSFHVDYWDYIGWQDPFASPRWSEPGASDSPSPPASRWASTSADRSMVSGTATTSGFAVGP